MKEPSDKLLSHFATTGEQCIAEMLGHPVDLTRARQRFQAKVKHFRNMVHTTTGMLGAPNSWPYLYRNFMFYVFGCSFMEPETVAELQAFLEAL